MFERHLIYLLQAPQQVGNPPKEVFACIWRTIRPSTRMFVSFR
jgi:hypothetical protein